MRMRIENAVKWEDLTLRGSSAITRSQPSGLKPLHNCALNQSNVPTFPRICIICSLNLKSLIRYRRLSLLATLYGANKSRAQRMPSKVEKPRKQRKRWNIFEPMTSSSILGSKQEQRRAWRHKHDPISPQSSSGLINNSKRLEETRRKAEREITDRKRRPKTSTAADALWSNQSTHCRGSTSRTEPEAQAKF